MTALDTLQPEAAARTATEAVVSVRGLTKVFKDFWGRPKARAVDNANFEVRRGEIFGLLGPNGSGKSTTIKMLLGLLYPTKGHIEIFGHSPRHVKTKARIGYLPEESYLYKYLDSRETLDFFGNLFQLAPGDRDKRTEQLLDMVGLSQVRSRTVGEFSKGMQRRIGLAQALINDPDLVILDEPTAGMDPLGCREVKDLILALKARGKTVILSSHLLSDVEDVCDRVVIYYGGKIQADGTLQELLKERDSIRVTFPALAREKVEGILGAIQREVPADRIKLDNPSQNLESYFLGVVNRARASEQTAGATSGNQVAEYLRGGAEAGVQQQSRVLDRLVAAPEAPRTAEPVVQVPTAAEVQAQSKLAALAAPSAPVVEPKVAVAPKPVMDEAKTNEKLANLLGKPKA